MKKILIVFGLLLTASASSFAQSGASTTYEFQTLSDIESTRREDAKILFIPAFQGKTEIQLEPVPTGFSISKTEAVYRQNKMLVNQQLEAVTAAGWELVLNITSLIGGQEYLFRRLKK